MTNVIVAFPKPEDAKSIRNILVKNGFPVVAVCTSGAQTLQYADDLHNGVVVCGYRLTDSVDAAVEESELRKKKARQQPKQRNVFDKQQIMLAKDLLMKQKGMTEEEAHRYLQKSSMANGVNMIETAQMVLSILGKNV